MIRQRSVGDRSARVFAVNSSSQLFKAVLLAHHVLLMPASNRLSHVVLVDDSAARSLFDLEEESMVTKEDFQGNWNQFLGGVQKKYSEITGMTWRRLKATSIRWLV